jgi:hypothetical protein
MQAIRQLPGVRHVMDYVRRNDPILPPEAVAHFNRAGYVIFDPGFPEEWLDRAIADMATHPDMLKPRHHGSRVMDGWRSSRAVRSIALFPRVLRTLRQIYGREPKPFQTLNFPVGTEQRPHSDVIHFASDPPSYMCGVWLALEDVDESNGALVYYPGSHMLPEVMMEDVAPGPGPQYAEMYEDYIQNMLAEKQLKPERGILKKGQALIWASNLIHGGGPHTDKSRTRHSQVTHYYFEGCQYYQPLSSYGGYRHLKINEWVR